MTKFYGNKLKEKMVRVSYWVNGHSFQYAKGEKRVKLEQKFNLKTSLIKGDLLHERTKLLDMISATSTQLKDIDQLIDCLENQTADRWKWLLNPQPEDTLNRYTFRTI